MTQPVDLPIVGKMHFRETSKEKLMEYWQGVEIETGIEIRYHELVANISALEVGYTVETSKGRYTTDTVLLAIGRRGTPRKLGVTGEDHPKVVYQLIDPQQYVEQKVLIVGGGDSAIEAALSIADAGGKDVSLSYRSDAFSRAKPKNRERIEEYGSTSRIRVYLSSNVTEITAQAVQLEQDGQTMDIPNDAIIVSAGGILPTGFLRQVGIQVETKYGHA